MDPAIIAALVGGGSNLLGSILGSFGPSKEEKAYEAEFESWEKKHKRNMEDIQKYLKPELPRYAMEKDLGTIDPAFKKIILGRLTDVLGPEKLGRWGVDPATLLAGIGGGGSPTTAERGGRMGMAEAPTEGMLRGKFGNKQISGDLANKIMQKYGLPK